MEGAVKTDLVSQRKLTLLWGEAIKKRDCSRQRTPTNPRKARKLEEPVEGLNKQQCDARSFPYLDESLQQFSQSRCQLRHEA